MAQQKLYTEEQVRSLLDKMNVIYSLEDLTPIELPIDKEIENEAHKQWGNVHRTGVLGFIDCAKWMRDKILNK